MELKEALKIVRAAGIKVDYREIKLKPKEIKRISDMLTDKGVCVVVYRSKKAMVHTLEGYKARLANAKKNGLGRNKGGTHANQGADVVNA